MKKFWTDRIALGSAAVGMILMAFTLAWRINPVEQSVVPRFLFDNPVGVAVFWVLFVTCMPVWIAGMILTAMLTGGRAPDWVPVWLTTAISVVGTISLQGLLYFLIGKGVSVCARRFLGKS
jgi:hypothetical protein